MRSRNLNSDLGDFCNFGRSLAGISDSGVNFLIFSGVFLIIFGERESGFFSIVFGSVCAGKPPDIMIGKDCCVFVICVLVV